MAPRASGRRTRDAILSRIRRNSPDLAKRALQAISHSASQLAMTDNLVQVIPMRNESKTSGTDATLSSHVAGNQEKTYKKRFPGFVGRKRSGGGGNASKESSKQATKDESRAATEFSQIRFEDRKQEERDDRQKIGSMPVEYLLQVAPRQLMHVEVPRARHEVSIRPQRPEQTDKPSSYQFQPLTGERRPTWSVKVQSSGLGPSISGGKSEIYSRSPPGGLLRYENLLGTR